MNRVFAASAVLLLASCTMGPYAPDYGDATRNNVAVQSVQPTPPTSPKPVAANGALAAVAQERYVTDKVKQPSATDTKSSAGGGGGNSGTSTGP